MNNYKILKEIEDKKEIFKTLKFHLESQAKSSSPKCRSEYYISLAKEVDEITKLIEKLFDS